ncbi:MAG: hypothetical protein OQJ77_01265 [Thiovulaceae bacterium]|nr:hypothetical protein [Sulfurimonadaceae bacterium]MCW9025918.1 hypothetical protein [Sulfurimonadaceae bacterium]
MVKLFLSLLFLFSVSFAEETSNQESTNNQLEINPLVNVESINPLVEELDLKIKSLLDEDTYKKNEAYINIVFSPKSDFIINDRIDSVKVVQTLKDNGLLKLYFDKPKELRINFHTSDNPLFFVKIMGDTLRNIGYYRYVTKESKLNESGFTWSITLKAEYVTDPQVLQKELYNSGSKIVDIIRLSQTEWTFSVDMRDAFLGVEMLIDGEQVELNRSLYSYWLDVSGIQKLKIESSPRNSWYPYITYFDSSLHLLKVVKRNTKRRAMYLNIPLNAKYIKISDIYTLKNIKDSLYLTPIGER